MEEMNYWTANQIVWGELWIKGNCEREFHHWFKEVKRLYFLIPRRG